MKNALNILSIDFDFFQIVDNDTLLTCYPDGHDLPTDLSKIIWSQYYANPQTCDKINAVTANHTLIGNLQMKLSTCNRKTPVMVTNSHVHIYDFIISQMTKSNKTQLNLINIDMHHDMFNNSKTLDCGNWISHIKQKYKTNLTWITNPISPIVYGLNEQICQMIQYDFDKLELQNIDGIFLCRSDIWLPPHLDYAFDQLLNFICSYFITVTGETNITECRDIHELVEQQKSIYERFTIDILP